MLINRDEYETYEDLLIDTVRQSINVLTLVQQENVYKSLAAFRMIYAGYDKVEAKLGLELLILEVTGVCSIDVRTAMTH